MKTRKIVLHGLPMTALIMCAIALATRGQPLGSRGCFTSAGCSRRGRAERVFPSGHAKILGNADAVLSLRWQSPRSAGRLV